MLLDILNVIVVYHVVRIVLYPIILSHHQNCCDWLLWLLDEYVYDVVVVVVSFVSSLLIQTICTPMQMVVMLLLLYILVSVHSWSKLVMVQCVSNYRSKDVIHQLQQQQMKYSLWVATDWTRNVFHHPLQFDARYLTNLLQTMTVVMAYKQVQQQLILEIQSIYCCHSSWYSLYPLYPIMFGTVVIGYFPEKNQ